RRGHRQGPRRLPHRPAARRPGPAPGHRGGPCDDQLRQGHGVEPGHDHRPRGGQVPGRGPVPAGQHGSQDRGGAALPGRGRRARGGHLAHPAGGDAGRSRGVGRHPHRAGGLAERAGAVTVSRVLAFAGAYRDSLLLLGATRAMQDSEDVSWASAAMATPSVMEDLEGRGFPPDSLTDADANALVLAVEAGGGPGASQALARGGALLFAEAGPDREGGASRPGEPDPRTVGEAARLLPEANVAVVSVPGQYAALAAHSALTAGLHVLLFSDN